MHLEIIGYRYTERDVIDWIRRPARGNRILPMNLSERSRIASLILFILLLLLLLLWLSQRNSLGLLSIQASNRSSNPCVLYSSFWKIFSLRRAVGCFCCEVRVVVKVTANDMQSFEVPGVLSM